MRPKATTVLVCLLALLGALPLVLSGRGGSGSDDPFVSGLAARIAVLRPLVEAALGEPLRGDASIVVSTSEEVARADRRDLWYMRSRGRREVPPFTVWSLGPALRADLDGVLHLSSDPKDRGERGFDALLARWPREVRDAVPLPGARPAPLESPVWTMRIAEELVRLHQYRAYDTGEWIAAAMTDEDLLARRAVLDGHRAFVAQRVLRAAGVSEDPYEGIAVAPGMGPGGRVHASFHGAYVFSGFPEEWTLRSGLRFMTVAADRLGPQQALRRAIALPPTLGEVDRPEAWLARDPAARPEPRTAVPHEELRRVLEAHYGPAVGSPVPPSPYAGFLRDSIGLVDDWTEERPRGPSAAEARRESAAWRGVVGGLAERIASVRYVEATRGSGWPSAALELVRASDADAAEEVFGAIRAAWIVRDADVPPEAARRRMAVLSARRAPASIGGFEGEITERTFQQSGLVATEEAFVGVRASDVVVLRQRREPGGSASLVEAVRDVADALAAAEHASATLLGSAVSPPGGPGVDRERGAAILRCGAVEDDPERLRREMAASPGARPFALRILARRGEVPESERLKILGDPTPAVCAIAFLPVSEPEDGRGGEHPDPVTPALIVSGIRGGNPQVTAAAWAWVVDADDVAGVTDDEWDAALRDVSGRVAAFAAQALRRICASEWSSASSRDGPTVDLLPRVRIALSHPSSVTRSSAAAALAGLWHRSPELDPVVAEVLARSFGESDEDVVVSFVDARALNGTQVGPALRGVLEAHRGDPVFGSAIEELLEEPAR